MARLVAAGDFGSEGERRTAAVLQELPPDWVVISNKVLVAGNARSFELDFIVIAEHWVFLIDEKSWRGRIVGSEDVWAMPDGSFEKSPVNKVDYVAKVLRGELSHRVAVLSRVTEHFVHGCVVLSQADQLPQVRDRRAAGGIFLLSDVVSSLKKHDAQGGSPTVGAARPEIVRRLVDFSPRPAVPKKVAFYDVTEARDLRPGVRLLTATLPGEGERKLFVYEANAEDAEFFLREFRALRALHATGLVEEVAEPFTWSDRYVVLPVTPSKRARPLSAIPMAFDRESLERELHIALVAFESLAEIHAHDVIHRAIDPTCVSVELSGAFPKIVFSDFHAARVGSESIASRLDKEEALEPYAAPELRTGFGAATAESDVFSLALVFLKRFSVKTLDEIRDGDAVAPAGLEEWDLLRPGLAADLAAFFGFATLARDSARPSARECADLLADLRTSVKAEGAVSDVERLLDNRYRVVRKLGEGTSAVTYLVEDTLIDGYFAVKRFKRASSVYDQARAEFKVLQEIHSPLLPRAYEMYEPTADIHLKMDYIEGPNLADLAADFPWDLGRWVTLARALLQAVGVLEARGLLHRDIKPANVVLRVSDGLPVLVDFGFATHADLAQPVAGTPRYLPPEAIGATQPPKTSDLYALGVLLYQVFTGHAVRAQLSPADSSHGHKERGDRDQHIRAFALRMCDASPGRRYQSVSEATEALDLALQVPELTKSDPTLTALVNPWVGLLRGGYRHSSVGNADNRGLDTEFARQTYVPTSLDEVLLPAILSNRPRVVFLSGNPGDGKTAFLEMLAEAIKGRGARDVLSDASGWEMRLQDHVFRSCFDASEAHGQLSADEQLDQKLAPLAGESDPKVALTVVVAINDGRLADFITRVADRYPWLERAVGRAGAGWIPTDPVWVVDLKRRSLAAPARGGASVMTRLIDVLVDEERWSICEGCAAKSVCPMKRNADDLRDRRSRPRARLEELLVLAHLRLVRHITIRDFRSTLSFLIAADTSCEEVHAERTGVKPPKAIRNSFWQTLFNTTSDDPLEIAIREMDPGLASTPHIDRFLSQRRNADQRGQRSVLFEDGGDVEPEVYSSSRDWLMAWRRRLWFHGKEAPVREGSGVPNWDLRQLLPYRYAGEFLKALADEAERLKQLPILLRGVTQSEGVSALATSSELTLKVGYSEEQRLLVAKRFAEERFRLVPDRGPESPVEAMTSILRLEPVSGGVAASITLDLYELLRRMADGLRPDADEFQPLLADLAAFKARLLLQESKELVLLADGRRSEGVALRDGKITRTRTTVG